MLTIIRQNGTTHRVMVFVRKGLSETLESRRQRYCSGTLELIIALTMSFFLLYHQSKYQESWNILLHKCM